MHNEFPAASESLPPSAIAIVGMAGRFPGANSVSEFWNNLRRGEESIVTLSEDELAAAGIGEKVLANPAYVRRAAKLDGIDEFDADFFGFAPQVARIMDPQHRLFLQCAWHALEDTGCDPAGFDGSIGVFGTSSSSGYLLHNIMSHRDQNALIGQGATFELINLSLQNDKDYLATRVSHQFNLRGPSIAIQTACSSSLVAVHLACQSVLSGECDMAIAGGASLRIPHHVGYWCEPGSMVSAVGHCRPFDVRADGTIFGSGVAVVVLKPFQAAVEDGDRIHAVIRGSAINNDGSMKMNYAAPNAAAQADVIAEAHAVSDVDSSTVSYIEAHGTATPLGDPIELDGLRKAFAISTKARPGPCVVGSVKSNVGHLEVASGITGLIKTILCLKNQALPATLHYTRPNPELHLDESPFVVHSEYASWNWDGVRRAGVSSFGVGGTNAHVVLEEAPAVPSPAPASGPQVLLLSAQTAESLKESRSALATELSCRDELNLSDVAFTLAGRRKHAVRMAAVVNDGHHAATVLRAPEHDHVFIDESADSVETNSDRVAFLFPGQGAQYIGMARGLYDAEPVFAEHFDRCAAGFREYMGGVDLRAEVFDGAGAELERTDRAQPALFAVEYALAKLIESYGVRPAALAGHSIGEYVAATIAGVFDLPTAIKSVSVRARLMNQSAPGVMVAVALGPDALAAYLSSDVDLAAVNDPGNCVVAGSAESVRRFQSRLAERGVPVRRIRTSHAFHSSSMNPVLAEFEDFLSGLTLQEPQTPLLSNITGTWMSADAATSPTTWARQIRATVRFADELDVLLTDQRRVLVEVGPGGSLTGSAIRHPRWSTGQHAVRLMRHQVQNIGDREAFLLGLGQLWSAAVEVDWSPLSPSYHPRLVTLPGYPFAHQKHWIEPRKVEWVEGPAANNGVSVSSPSSSGAAGHMVANDGETQMETTLLGIWTQCLGVNSIGRNDNFFDLGGDSLIAIGVAMSAANQGLDLTPQDLYEHQTVAALTAALAARYTEGGLAGPVPDDVVNPPVPPTITHFLDHGLRDVGRWRVPLILRLSSGIGLEDVRSVLTAVTNHHDALRMRIVERAGSWEQEIAAPEEFSLLETRSIPTDAGGDSGPGSPREREAVMDILDEQIRAQDLSSTPFAATYVVDAQGVPRYLAMSVHEMVCDTASREILLTDIFTAFAQLRAGEDIALSPTGATWREWSLRSAALATHPAVLEGRGYWIDNSTRTTVRLTEHDIAEAPNADDLVRLSSSLTSEQTSDLDHARRRFRFGVDEVLLAALGRTIAQTIGGGVVTVDLRGDGRSVLKPELDPRRVVGGFTTIYPLPLTCTDRQSAGAIKVLEDLNGALKAVPYHGIGHGLLRYVYAPTARLLAVGAPPDILLSNEGVIPELASVDAPVQMDADAAMSVRDKIPGLGHAIELRVYRTSGTLHLDWWYDSRRVRRSTVEALMQNYSAALTDLVYEAIASCREDEPDTAITGPALVDLTAES